jgi:cytochrome P450
MKAPLPPGPRGHWLQGHLPDFRGDRLEFMARCVRDYGDVVGLRFGHRCVYLINHPDIFEEILVTQSGHFIKNFALRINPLVFGKGLLVSEGDFWLKQRRLIQPAFSRSRLAEYSQVMVDATQAMLASWKSGEIRDIYTDMMRLTLAITARTLFDSEVDGDAAEVSKALHLLQENFLVRINSLLPLPMWVPTPQNLRQRKIVRKLDEIIFRFIRQRRQAPVAKPDLLSILLQAQDENGSRMTDRQVRDEAMTLFLAGHETTALALSWTWHLLAQHPEVEEKLQAEVDQVLGSRVPTFEDLPQLKYAEQVIQESMRVLPPVYLFGREAIDECVIGGFRVKKGTTLLMSQWLIHRDPRFFEQPEKFLPERWTEELARNLPKFAYVPFGGGPRVCIGNTFAMTELVLVLAAIAQRFRFTAKAGHEVVLWPTFTLRPRNGILANPVERKPATKLPRGEILAGISSSLPTSP